MFATNLGTIVALGISNFSIPVAWKIKSRGQKVTMLSKPINPRMLKTDTFGSSLVGIILVSKTQYIAPHMADSTPNTSPIITRSPLASLSSMYAIKMTPQTQKIKATSLIMSNFCPNMHNENKNTNMDDVFPVITMELTVVLANHSRLNTTSP